MGWRRIKDRLLTSNAEAEPAPAPVVERPLTVSPPIRRRNPGDRDAEQRLADLRRRRAALLYDIDQGLLAREPENPWVERIALLSETLAIVQSDLAALESQPRTRRPALEATPILTMHATSAGEGDLYAVEFVIAGERFRFEEQADWDQRGGPRVRGDLQQVSGDAARLVPSSMAGDDAAALAEHLRGSVIVFATDLRDRALAGEPLPPAPTLADLARPCPTCGGWSEWGGRCPECTARDLERQPLQAEFNRLDDERRKEAAERHRLAEGVSISQRRLDAVDADIRTLGGDPS